MKHISIFLIASMLFATVWFNACATTKAPADGPRTTPESPEMPHLDLPPDHQMHRVIAVIMEYGRKTRDFMTYGAYRELMPDETTAVSPEYFYDRYVLDLNEDGHWVTMTLSTARRAKARDPRIASFMLDFPENALDVTLQTAGGRSFLLSDQDADGVLDFASPLRDGTPTATGVDIALMKSLQPRYTWVLRILKRHAK